LTQRKLVRTVLIDLLLGVQIRKEEEITEDLEGNIWTKQLLTIEMIMLLNFPWLTMSPVSTTLSITIVITKKSNKIILIRWKTKNM